MEPVTPLAVDDRILLDMPGKTYAGVVLEVIEEPSGDNTIVVVLDEQPDLRLEWPESRLRREAA